MPRPKASQQKAKLAVSARVWRKPVIKHAGSSTEVLSDECSSLWDSDGSGETWDSMESAGSSDGSDDYSGIFNWPSESESDSDIEGDAESCQESATNPHQTKLRNGSLAAKFRMHLATLQADSKWPGPMLSQTELEDFFDMEISDGIQSSVKPWVNLRRVQTNSQSEDKLQQTLSKYFGGVLNATEHDLQIPKRQRNHRKGIKYNGKSERTLYRMDKSAQDERMKHS
ncbi:hypothetical protein HDU78_000484 [Chytriomyces hyalinus]|nr:hypothetical protein HDU78_000484 [Chytriomyces hyalinus]